MLSKSLIQFSVDGRGCVLSLLFDPRPNYGGDNEDTGDSFRRSHDALLRSASPTKNDGLISADQSLKYTTVTTAK